MSSNAIFLKVENALAVLRETPYDSEAVLQTALAENPEVRAGPTTEGDDTGRLLFLTQEMPVPNSADGTGAQRLDHLFLDHEGVPVLVEVKRSSDTRIRREVVGQMLDYAANAVKYWPVATLQAALEGTATAMATTVEELSGAWVTTSTPRSSGRPSRPICLPAGSGCCSWPTRCRRSWCGSSSSSTNR